MGQDHSTPVNPATSCQPVTPAAQAPITSVPKVHYPRVRLPNLLFKKFLWYLSIFKGISALLMSGMFFAFLGISSTAESKYRHETAEHEGKSMNLTSQTALPVNGTSNSTTSTLTSIPQPTDTNIATFLVVFFYCIFATFHWMFFMRSDVREKYSVWVRVVAITIWCGAWIPFSISNRAIYAENAVPKPTYIWVSTIAAILLVVFESIIIVLHLPIYSKGDFYYVWPKRIEEWKKRSELFKGNRPILPSKHEKEPIEGAFEMYYA